MHLPTATAILTLCIAAGLPAALANQDMYCVIPGHDCYTVAEDIDFTRSTCNSCGGTPFNVYFGVLCNVNGQQGACFAHACDTTHKSKHCFYNSS
jgi:hypothetical protein